MTHFQKSYYVAVPLALAIFLGCIAATTYQLFHNTFSSYADWVSTKTQLKKGVMGAMAFTHSQQPLARNTLNLSAWFGHQMVSLRQEIPIRRFKFDFYLKPQAYLNVLYDITDEGNDGIRLSTNSNFPSTRFKASALGEFLRVEPLAIPWIEENTWHELAVSFEGASIALTLNGMIIGKFSHPDSIMRRIGFRGSQRATYIDDIIIRGTDSEIINESFHNRDRSIPVFVIFIALVTALNVIVALAFFIAGKFDLKFVGLNLIMANIVGIVMVFTVYAYQYIQADNYGLVKLSDREIEKYWIRSSRRDILQHLTTTFPLEGGSENRRVLFLGASQTWGAGARTQAETWVAQIQILSESDPRHRRIECINAGVSGMKAEQVFDFLSNDLLYLNPDVVVVNLASNDVDLTSFEENLEKIIELLIDQEIQPLLIPEANSIERPEDSGIRGDIRAKHSIVRRIAQDYRIPVVELHRYLADRYDDGFLWWDYVHLTSFGQRLMAEKTYDVLRTLPILAEDGGRINRGPQASHPQR